MMNINIEINPAAIDPSEWERFVSTHPQGNIFQTSQMFQLYSQVKRHDPILIAAYANGEMKGILLAVIQREMKSIIGRLSARAIIWGGPLVQNDDMPTFIKIMSAYDQIARKSAIYSQCRNLFPRDHAKTEWENIGYSYEDHLDIIIDLKQPVTEIWKKLHPTRRKQIERGYRRGVNFRFVQNPDEQTIAECQKLIETVYRKIRLPSPGPDFFLAASRCFKEKLGLFLLNNNSSKIGCRFVLLYNKNIYDWYAGADPGQLDKYPNDILSWEAMKWGAENGYAQFDFGGAGKPGIPYGVRDYKMKFGGELVNFGRFEKNHQPIKKKIAKLGFRVWQFIKR